MKQLIINECRRCSYFKKVDRDDPRFVGFKNYCILSMIDLDTDEDCIPDNCELQDYKEN